MSLQHCSGFPSNYIFYYMKENRCSVKSIHISLSKTAVPHAYKTFQKLA